LPTSPTANTADVLEVVSPFWVMLSDVHVDNTRRELFIEVKSYWSDLGQDVSVSLIPRATDGHRSERIAVTPGDWTVTAEPDGTNVYARRFPAPEGPLSIHLNFGRESVLERLVGVGSTRVVAHELLDPEFALLRTCLFSRED